MPLFLHKEESIMYLMCSCPFFSQSTFHAPFTSHSFSVDLDQVDSEKPDIVIFELAQRNLTVLR